MTEEHIQRGQQWLEQLLVLMGLPATVRIEEVQDIQAQSTSQWLVIDSTNLTAEQAEVLVGEAGKNIDAIQYLANTLLNLHTENKQQSSYTVELNGYRARRQKELFDLALQVAQEVRETGKEMAIESLSSAERRQIHTFLESAEDLETESKGQEPDRRLIVKLKN